MDIAVGESVDVNKIENELLANVSGETKRFVKFYQFYKIYMYTYAVYAANINIAYIEDITRRCEDMNFIFEW